MKPDFRLNGECISRIISVYTESAKQVISSLNTFQCEVDSVMGKGWKGKASEKFIKIIEDYEKETQSFLNEIERFYTITSIAGQRLGVLEDQASNIGKQMRKCKL